MLLMQNLQDTIAQVIEGEAILIVPHSGVYHSLNPMGTWIWQQFAGGSTLEAVSTRLQGHFSQQSGVSADVEALVAEMVRERLLVEMLAAPGEANFAAPLGPYLSPEMLTFRDLGDLLALDPPAPGLAEVTWGGG